MQTYKWPWNKLIMGYYVTFSQLSQNIVVKTRKFGVYSIRSNNNDRGTQASLLWLIDCGWPGKPVPSQDGDESAADKSKQMQNTVHMFFSYWLLIMKYLYFNVGFISFFTVTSTVAAAVIIAAKRAAVIFAWLLGSKNLNNNLARFLST